MPAARLSMYENGSLRQVTDGPLRPGGLALTGHLLDLCELPEAALVLDAGCGEGGTGAWLQNAGYRAVGVDRSARLIRAGLLRNNQVPLMRGTGTRLPLPAGIMDSVIAECSLSAMADCERVLDEFQRVLRPGGKLALSDIYARNPAGVSQLHALRLQCGLRYAMTQADLAARLNARGFEILAWEDHSDSLKHLAAQITLSHGSLCEFWHQSEPEADPFEIVLGVNRAKLGYYLLIAEKRSIKANA